MSSPPPNRELDRLLNRLVKSVRAGEVVPVVGPGLFVVELDGVRARLEWHYARALAERLDLGEEEVPGVDAPAPLDAVAKALRLGREDGRVRAEFYGELDSIIATLVPTVPVPPAVARLAGMPSDRTFLVPFVLDELSPSHERLDACLRREHAERAPEGRCAQELLTHLRHIYDTARGVAAPGASAP